MLPRGIDSFVGSCDKEVRQMAAALWKDITDWARLPISAPKRL